MWMQGKEPGAGSGLNAVVRDFGNRLDLSFVDESGRFACLSLSKQDSPATVAAALRMLASYVDIPWPEAEALRTEGVPIECRDGGAFHRELAWRPVDGPITEHMADFEFRKARPAGVRPLLRLGGAPLTPRTIPTQVPDAAGPKKPDPVQ